MFHNIIVIGAGASGIMASITAKDNGKDVAILESKNRMGNKILSTGNGRCNITNKNIIFTKYHSRNLDFVKNILNKFSVRDTITFFDSLGLPLTTLENGKMYPLSLQASSVLDILRMAIEDRNIPIYLNSKVTDIIRDKKYFKLFCRDKVYKCNKIILCTGGKSAPHTGSDGSGFNICKNLGHSIITPLPALVQLKLRYDHLRALSGVKFNGYVEILVDNEIQQREYGEILFTDYGISGPPILEISRIASCNLLNKRSVKIRIDMLPDLKRESLLEFLENHWGTFNYRSVYNSLIGIINKKIIPILLKEAAVNDIHKPCYELSWREKKSICNLLKCWEFMVYDTNSFKNSQVTCGGVSTDEIDYNTLESKKIEHLYLAGEILDVDGCCGGFNLQWAWSSGFVAGTSAAES
ncbi:NAD(P)/FAD-dependent oxidoreductase [Clostridium sp. MT-14]|uniref:NAD(P)/FAD-dependent oxidoreductase n=1 Tax=Clostridium aromativorans TaxID=2836848 RepID=A0ABS8N3Q2_9CLOT|nr:MULTISPECIES: NAD(P)/FAD-dependent oxidoreductase [Clostridium]KAA8674973.1 NAD(P)/FAD-dependent oxidoreductase [Clostridium sp. HV4-5-A1G]MCC9294445.1 NAD(P)/FAD-dependent oxidoreductase [Clostridium aromativorans]CAB1255168.1 Tricarballylate dehydrogenase [Clostridiaceae bacterium BL-3]